MKSATRGRMSNTGQACNAAKRFVVLEPYYDEFVAKLTESFEAMVPGDPMDPKTAIGPLSSQGAADTLTEQVEDAVVRGRDGARRRQEGRRPRRLRRADPARRRDARGCARYSEELFGPVGVVYKVSRRRRGRRADQLLVVRAVRLGVEQRPGRRPARSPTGSRSGMAFVNEHGTTLPGAALRRREALRLRPRARPVGHGRVRQQEARAGLEGLSRVVDVAGTVRRICLALPEATERTSHGSPAFYVGKQFVMLWPDGAPRPRLPPPLVRRAARRPGGARRLLGAVLPPAVRRRAGLGRRTSRRRRALGRGRRAVRGRLPDRRARPARGAARQLGSPGVPIPAGRRRVAATSAQRARRSGGTSRPPRHAAARDASRGRRLLDHRKGQLPVMFTSHCTPNLSTSIPK